MEAEQDQELDDSMGSISALSEAANNIAVDDDADDSIEDEVLDFFNICLDSQCFPEGI